MLVIIFYYIGSASMGWVFWREGTEENSRGLYISIYVHEHTLWMEGRGLRITVTKQKVKVARRGGMDNHRGWAERTNWKYFKIGSWVKPRWPEMYLEWQKASTMKNNHQGLYRGDSQLRGKRCRQFWDGRMITYKSIRALCFYSCTHQHSGKIMWMGEVIHKDQR